eukprot:TRINITY_DN46198_c0_g1_i1.p1 TRINITY_DN46198_c0_g1~~TRINITY_DN46198_c0_g1_i1.p1  ORF type:complete len:334 (-),score=80.02 TRINITY_DN46198_c0_g1_i1:128-1129(-)
MGSCCTKAEVVPRNTEPIPDHLPRQPSLSALKNGQNSNHGSVKQRKGRVSIVEANESALSPHSRPKSPDFSSPVSPETKSNTNTMSEYDLYTIEDLQREALSGNIECMYRLAKKYRDSGEDESSFHWMVRAADRGHVEALYRIGAAYEKGKGTKRNLKKAWESFAKAGDAFHAKSITKMGNFHEKKLVDRSSNEEAFRLYKMAAEMPQNPDPEAYYYLGLCYSGGIGTTKDPKLAFEAFEKAAKARIPRGICNLAFCYENGNGVKKDVREAAELYEEAASLENSTAMFRLGYLHEKGALGDEDIKTAKEWYKKAAALGNEDAKKKLERLGVRI